MSDSSTNADRVLVLAGLVFGKTASDDELVELNSILAADEASRRRYLRFCEFHIALRAEMRASCAVQKVCQRISAEADTIGTDSVKDAASANFVLPSTIVHNASGYFSASWPVAYLVATVVLGIGLVVGAVTRVSQPTRIVHHSPSTRGVRSASPPQVEIVGRVTGMVDCKWSKGSVSLRNNDVVLLGREVKLESGWMEILYGTGAKVILQGPVTYQMEARNGGLLTVGKFTGKIENATAKGFVLRTHDAVITDLGTEFGVEIAKDGATETRVFVGRVEITAVAKGPDANRQSHVIRAGQFARVKGEEIALMPTSQADAGKTWAPPVMPTPRSPQSADEHANVVLSMHPTVYYRMEPPTDKKDRTTVFDSASGGHHGLLSFSDEYRGQPYGVGRVGQSLHFRGQMTGDHAIVPDYPKTTNGQLTVSAWVMAKGRSQWPMIAANWAEGKINGHECTGQFHFGLHWDGEALAVGITQRNGQFVKLHDRGSQSFRLGMWQHVAFVADGAKLHLYRNGVEVASAPCDGILPNPTVACLGIGCKTNPLGTGAALSVPGYWQGWIDELAIFNKAMSAAEIRRLAADNKRGVWNDDAITREGSGDH